jgi:putative sterol carrier protein
MPVFPSEDWIAAWVSLSNRSAEFRASGAGWEGSVALEISADPAAGFPTTVYVRLDGLHGQWVSHAVGRDVRVTDGALFILRAPYPAWKQVVRQQLHPLKGLLQGKIVVHGHLPAVLRWAKSLTILAELAGQIETEFADEQPARPMSGRRSD